MIAPGIHRELARERERQLAHEREQELTRQAARRRDGLLAGAAPTIGMMLGIALLAAVWPPVIP